MSQEKIKPIELLAYVGIQGLAFALDNIIFFSVLALGLTGSLIVALGVARTISSVFAFFMHSQFTFPQKKKRGLKAQLTSFYAMILVHFFFTALCLQLLTQIGWSPLFAKIIIDILGALLVYLAMKFVTFLPADWAS